MSLVDKIQQDLKQALKESDEAVRDTVRLLLAQMKNRSIELAKDMLDMADNEIIPVVKKEIKKRKESIEIFNKGDRAELADKESQELKILEKYVPEEMSEAEVEKNVVEVVAELGGKEKVNFGQVMKEVMAKLEGQADGKLVSAKVKKFLE